ncbi:hypothetical protein JXA32_11395 [Candidatus Sumerlaeota bacterium]|nr:hypothetical protein [Candidatus Sumerlaeota bacterium]
MTKEICKWESFTKSNFKKLKEIVEKPKYICLKCGRVANDKSYLCKSKSIE